MPLELVLLSGTAPTECDIITAAAAVAPDAAYLDWGDGTIRQVLGAAGDPLVQVFRSRPVADPTVAAWAVTNPEVLDQTTISVWTDVTVARYAGSAVGRAIAQALADSIDGTIAERR
ncbi:MAG: hypothetical protein FWE61_05195 [Micrococcales bacterium]|nr:hypothetical protein [Micrococcales bacterium]